jgi:tetratricopeptide (TPR) repeat protein
LDYWRRAVELSEKAALLEMLSIPPSGEPVFFLPTDSLLAYYEKALGLAKKAKDKYLIGSALDWLASITAQKSHEIEDSPKWFENTQTAQQYRENARHQLSAISFVSPLYPTQPQLYWILSLWETDLRKKRALLEKAVVDGAEAIKLAERSGYPATKGWSHHDLSKAFGCLAQIETNAEKKRWLLEKALEHRDECNKIIEQLFPFSYWDRGILWNYVADLKAELSDIEKNAEKRRNMLEEAISNKDLCLQLCTKDIFYEKSIHFRRKLHYLGYYQYSYGEMLNHVSGLINNNDHQRKAIKAFEEAAELFQKLKQFSRVAECYWKAARVYDALSEHLKAAENFELASENYRLAAEKIPQLTGFYSDYASFMRAWAEIERSRHEREKESYGKSGEHYRACSRLLEMTKKWSYLSSYYFAWSLLDHGESLSRLDRPQDAIKALSEAGRTFGDFANSLGKKVGELDNSEERDEATKLAKVAGLRRQYCMGRVLMEEAMLSNSRGDRVSSAEKYASAAGIFEEIAPDLERDEAREELRFAAAICEAWEKMELAEERGDSALYKKASELFAKASEISRRKTATLTAMGNSCFCEALEIGMKFLATSNADFYSEAKLRMENAAGYYQRAGFEKPALWVKATKRLFDAYVYVGKAEAEPDPEKRVKFYLIAEKCLVFSARFFGKAGNRGKKNEVLKYSERVRKERELAFSLSEVLTAPAVLRSTTRVSMPDLTEKTAGSNGFESVNIRAGVSVPKEFVPGEEFEVKLDLANVGKTPGLLVRIEGLVPPGSEVLRLPSYCALEGSSLNMRGKRLDSLCVESVSVWVKNPDLASVSLSPNVVYVDELGNFKTTRAEEVKILPVVEFESEGTQVVFNYLVDAFVEDCVKLRLGVDRSGWRSFPQIIKGAKVSKRSLYGAGGRIGKGLSELQRKGLVEVETLLGERGRGGHILKVRIHHAKELVRRYVQEKAPNLLT